MDVRHLEYFLAVVDHGGVTKAAAALYISQPSLSQALRAFERSAGVTLFHRDGRGVSLTAEGRALVEPARRILVDVAAARDAVGEVTRLAVGRLDIATDATLAVDPLASIAGRLHRRHPGVKVNAIGPDNGDVADAVRRGSCELGLTDLPLKGTSLRALPLGSQELHLVLPPDAPPGPDPVRLDALGDTPLLLPPDGFTIRDVIDAAFESVGTAPQVAVQCGHLEALANMVFEGAGAAFFPAALAEAWGRAGAVVRVPRPAPVRAIGIVHRPGPLSPAAAAFLDAAGVDPEAPADQRT
ncbi:LysR family transcriptional regulator [Saccharopolyspora shandongensis]|uniref:LysR family transcriptional regulator n=1 Tax=Saccharopolyspora shandongensis TaxID=418495 RepID=UPI0033EE0EE7